MESEDIDILTHPFILAEGISRSLHTEVTATFSGSPESGYTIYLKFIGNKYKKDMHLLEISDTSKLKGGKKGSYTSIKIQFQ